MSDYTLPSSLKVSKGDKPTQVSENTNDDCVNVSPEVNCVAKRTRSHFSESEKKKMKFGTVSRTLCVDEEELESLPGHEYNGDGNEVFHSVRKTRSNNGKIGSKEGNDNNKGKSRKLTKRKHIRNKIFRPVTDIVLPLKFTFGVEEPTPPEKSEYEKELDKLWAQMNFPDPDVPKENEDNVSPNVELDTADLCRHGNHQLRLDEEIGMICKLCSYVLEIRYIVPPFCADPFEKPHRRDYGRVD